MQRGPLAGRGHWPLGGSIRRHGGWVVGLTGGGWRLKLTDEEQR